jgi:hypothetical protein
VGGILKQDHLAGCDPAVGPGETPKSCQGTIPCPRNLIGNALTEGEKMASGRTCGCPVSDEKDIASLTGNELIDKGSYALPHSIAVL